MSINFINRETQNSNKYTITYQDGTSETIFLNSQETVITPGTKLNAETLNAFFGECVQSTYQGGLKVLPCSQEQYDSLAEKDDNTLYLIKE